MTGLFTGLLLIASCWPAPTSQPAPEERIVEPSADRPLPSLIRAELRVPREIVPVGSEVVVEFVLQNLTSDPVRLNVPGALPAKDRSDYGMGLPLEHVFSGASFRALEIVSEENPRMGDRVMRKPEYPVPSITLAPFGSIGLRFDVARFYPGLHQSGIYRVLWRPYGGAIETEPMLITVVQYKQVILETEYGTLAIELLYDKAPRTVANFLDLVDRRFYNGKTFHTVFPGQFILGGCSVGDGTGRRPDGMTIPPEFNDTPFDEGIVGMALIEGDADSASSQFFICLTRQAAWDGKYTAFARVRGPQSLATLRKLGTVEVDEQNRPVKPLLIKSMSTSDLPYTPRQAP